MRRDKGTGAQARDAGMPRQTLMCVTEKKQQFYFLEKLLFVCDFFARAEVGSSSAGWVRAVAGNRRNSDGDGNGLTPPLTFQGKYAALLLVNGDGDYGGRDGFMRWSEDGRLADLAGLILVQAFEDVIFAVYASLRLAFFDGWHLDVRREGRVGTRDGRNVMTSNLAHEWAGTNPRVGVRLYPCWLGTFLVGLVKVRVVAAVPPRRVVAAVTAISR